MLYLKKIKLQNFCSYQNHTFNFEKSHGIPYRYICFFGPNGSGKSTLLEAISLLTASHQGRSSDNIIRSLKKFVRNKNYNPSYNRIINDDNLPRMEIEGTFILNDNEYIVRISQDGFERNDFEGDKSPWGENSLFYRKRLSHLITSDSDLSMSKFQLRKEKIELFQKITSSIMRYPTICERPSGLVPMDEEYSTDFVIIKNKHNIHYKRMSAGEKKVAKSFSQLLNLIYDLEHPDPGEPALIGWPRILLIDNVEMHVYYDRHVQMIECLKENFPNQQIFTTTHSGILIERFLKKENDQDSELMINLEKNQFSKNDNASRP